MGISTAPNLRNAELFGGEFVLRLAYGKVPRPAYAYGIYQAALLAERLGSHRISVVEFGVAGGRGLVAMEEIVSEVEKIFPVEIEIFGFDAVTGLPEPIDYRDLPYNFAQGAYEMDEHKLRRRLKRAQLVLGDVSHTVPAFLKNQAASPIGFVAFDLDFYSSTVNALKLFDASQERLLPRVFCYFDDVIGYELSVCNEWVGELLAIKEFNAQHELRKIAPIYGLRHKRSAQKGWSEKIVAVRAGVVMCVPAGHTFILVGKEHLGIEKVGDRLALPFLEQNGSYWGEPPDDATAISELKRMRKAGASFITFSEVDFWWFDHYVGFNAYLRSKFACVIDTAHFIAFDLRRHIQSVPLSPTWLRKCLLGAHESNLSGKYREVMIALTPERDEEWNDQIFVLHTFNHNLYDRYVGSVERPQAPLD